MARTVLVIDDEPDVQTYLATLLEKEGFTVVTAGDGEEGFTRAVESKPDLIFLDIMMPKKTGIMLYRRIRKEPTIGAVPVVILTGLSQYRTFFAQDFEQIPHPEAFVEKPPKPEELIALARRLTHQSA
ncbi:MAG TPA: response regulator [Vicinamibacterales bacterium]|nr:response regulator [Vicinamibacterales bacterium]